MGISGTEPSSVLAVGSSPSEETLGTGKAFTDLPDKISVSPDQQGLGYMLKGS